MEKLIKGNIEYQIVIKDGMYQVQYPSNQNNDIAALGIVNQMFSDLIDYYAEERKKLEGKHGKDIRDQRAFVTNIHNSLKRAKAGGDKIMSMLLNTYDGYQENQKEINRLKDEKHEEIKKYFADNNITVENGIMSQEDAEKLLKDKYPDLMKDSPKENLSDFGVEGDDDSKIYKLENDTIIPKEDCDHHYINSVCTICGEPSY